MTKKIIDNIEPFNDIHFYNCSLHALFSIVRHYNRPIYPFLCKPLYGFGVHGEILIESKSRKIQDVLDEIGIIQYSKNKSEDVIEDLKKALSLERPAMIFIDSFYEMIREDSYHKNHVPHAILIYGYDDDMEKFYIVEHKYHNSVFYIKRNITYYDIAKCYNGGIEKLNLHNRGATFYEYAVNPEFRGVLEKSDCYIDYLKEMKKEIRLFENNLEEFYYNISNFIQCISNVENLDCVIDLLSSLVEEKSKEKYLYEVLSQCVSDKTKDAIGLVINEWTIIRGIIVKMKYSNMITKQYIDNIESRINNIYRYELILQQELANI